MDLAMVIMWSIWHHRNLVVFEGVRKDPQRVAYMAMRYLEEYTAGQSEGRKWARAVTDRWIPPATGRLKVNTDSDVFAETSSVGFGAVVCDHEGLVIAAASKRQNGLYEPSLVEAMAL